MSALLDTLVPRQHRAASIAICVIVVIDALSFGVTIPVLPKLVQQLTGGDLAQGAITFGIFGSVWSLMQFLFSPLLGAVSDRFGRRPVLLVSCFGLGLDYIVMALSPTIGWLLLGRIISGICTANITTASAYVADVALPEHRATAFGMIGAAFGIGFTLGPTVGGLLGDIDPRLPFWAAAVLTLISGCYALFVLPESLPAAKRDIFSWKKANPVGSLALLRSHAELLGLAFINFLFNIAYCVLPSMLVLYTSYRYGWDTTTVGLTLMVAALLSIAVQAGLINPAIRYFGERGALHLGLLFGAISFLGIAFAPTSSWAWAFLPGFALTGLFAPGLQSLMSQHVAVHEQGKLQGANTSLASLAGLIGPGLFTFTFAHFIDKDRAWTLPGAPFFIASGLLVLALLLAMRWARWDMSTTTEAVPSPSFSE